METTHFFSRQMDDGIYLISAKEWIQKTSSTNCWLIQGDTKALLLDAGLPCKGLKEYVQTLVSKDLMLALTHGHFDHAGAIDEFDEIWMHEDDIELLKGTNGLPASPFHGIIHTIDEKDTIDLGNRLLKIYRIQGHTKGSLCFLDEKSKILFSGDSIARRGFFTQVDSLPLSKYFDDLLKVETLDFNKVASCHDSYFLDKTQIYYFIHECIEGIYNPDGRWNLGKDWYLSIHRGINVEDPKYLSISILESCIDSIKEDISIWKENHKDYLQYHTIDKDTTYHDLTLWNETKEYVYKFFLCRESTWNVFSKMKVPYTSFNYIYTQFIKKQRIDYAFYTPEEMMEDPTKKDTGLFYFPANKENAPFIFLIPGGGYQSVCTAFEGIPIVKQLNEAGYTVFILQYRVRQVDLMPKPLKDAKRALSFIIKNKDYFKVNDNYAIMGFSAGAHLAGLLTTTNLGLTDIPYPKVNILCYPLIDMDLLMDNDISIKIKEAIGMNYPDEYSITKHMDITYPPTYLWQCKDDDTVSIENSFRMSKKLESLNIPYKYVTYDTGGHGLMKEHDKEADKWLDLVIEFMKGYL
ncbi:MAG: MBL fold metallo-hydrolase [Holdemanella sp.]|nr:MBL fold metallo-hydrolase [Holdemanella sp.]